MARTKILEDTVHQIPSDLRSALSKSAEALDAWNNITPLARNEWICWVLSVKTDKTRQNHVDRTVSELKDGIRRPCCWVGCIHRTDKKMSKSQTFFTKNK